MDEQEKKVRDVSTSSADGPSMSAVVRRLEAVWQSELVSREPVENLAGRQIGPYRIERLVGVGAFGIVYQGRHLRSERMVAIKFPRWELLANQETLTRFQSEVLANARLEHDAIVPILEADLTSPQPYIASTFIDGPDLARWLTDRSQTPLPVEAIVRFMLILTSGIAHAHSKGVVHRDIKPSNILMSRRQPFTESNELDAYLPKLTDFGLAKLVTDPIVSSRSSLVIGTPLYMAPEQLLPNWGPITERTDLYSLGVLLFELFEGHPPRLGMNYTDIMATLLQETPWSSGRWSERVPYALRQIVQKCLEVDPIDRFASAQELGEALEQYLGDRPFQGRTRWEFRSLRRWARHPNRPVEICSFIIPLNLVLFVWMSVNAALMTKSAFQAESRVSEMIQCVALAATHNLIVIALCFLRIRNHRWAAPVAMYLSIGIGIVLPISIWLEWVPFFDELYTSAPYYRAAVLALIVLFGLFKAALLAIAVHADRIAERRKTLGQHLTPESGIVPQALKD